MKVRIWQEPWNQRVFPVPEGPPLVINKGQVVVMAVVDSWEESADALRDLMLQLRKRTDG